MFTLIPRELDRRVLVFSLASTVIMLGAGIISPVLPLYAAAFGASITGAGALVSAFAVGRFLFDYIGGTLADRVSARWMAGGGAALTALAALLCGLARSFPMLILYRGLEGIGSAFYVTTAMAFITRTVTPEKMGRVMGFYQGMILLGVSLGPAVGGYLAHVAGLRAPFFAYALLSAVVAATAGKVVAEMPPPQPGKGGETRGGVHTVVRDRAFVFAIVLTMLIFATRAGLRLNLIPLFADAVVRLNEFWIGIILTVASFVNFLVLWHAGALIDRQGRRRVVLPVLAATTVVVVGFAWARSFGLLLLETALLGAMLGYLAPVPAAIIADVTPAAVSGQAMGVYRMAGDLGLFLGPLTFGYVANGFGFSTGFWFSASLVATVWLLGVRTRETLRPVTTRVAGQRIIVS
ncbi:MAG: MFS transporter [Candidatus Binatia bacterium]